MLSITALGACGAPPDPVVQAPANPAGSLTPAATSPLPSALIGQWTVTGAGIERGTIINVEFYDINIFLKCGILSANWDARPGGSFLAGVYGSLDRCYDRATPAWVTHAAAFVVDGPRRHLLNNNDELIATLTPARHRPRLASTVAPEVANPPRLDRAGRAELDQPTPPMPPKTRAAQPEDLIGGMWMLPDRQGYGAPDLTFSADSSYHGSDGCNGMGGRWAAPDGFMFTTGPTTLIGCGNLNLLEGVHGAGMNGDQLVLLDMHGNELHRLVRIPVPEPSPATATTS